MSAQWTATSSHALACAFSSPPTYWMGFCTCARSGSSRGYRDWPVMTGPRVDAAPEGPSWPFWPLTGSGLPDVVHLEVGFPVLAGVLDLPTAVDARAYVAQLADVTLREVQRREIGLLAGERPDPAVEAHLV